MLYGRENYTVVSLHEQIEKLKPILLQNNKRIWLNPSTSKQLTIPDQPFLLYSKQTSNPPITTFKLTEKQPCLNPHEETTE
jgi:hypothetical protein